MTDQTKPEPIVIGVSGFKALDAEPKPQDFVDWGFLFGLPPFEMYLSEKVGNQNRLMWQDWLLKELANKDEQAVYQAYADWHANKGYWVNETPLGQIKE